MIQENMKKSSKQSYNKRKRAIKRSLIHSMLCLIIIRRKPMKPKQAVRIMKQNGLKLAIESHNKMR